MEWESGLGGRSRQKHVSGGKRMREWEEGSVTGLRGWWHPSSPQIFRDKNTESPWRELQNFPTSIAIWEFWRVFPPLFPTPLLSNLVEMRSLFICSISTNTTFAYTCPLFKNANSSSCHGFQNLLFENHWHTQRKGRSPWNGRILFLSRFLCKNCGQAS